jgi:hypothetical protein
VKSRSACAVVGWQAGIFSNVGLTVIIPTRAFGHKLPVICGDAMTGTNQKRTDMHPTA